MTEDHPNAALTRRVFAAFGKDAMAISAALSRDIVWRVPGDTVMSGEYRGRRTVVEFLQRTGLETNGTYGSKLHTVFANDEWGLAVYRAWGHRPGARGLDVRAARRCLPRVTQQGARGRVRRHLPLRRGARRAEADVRR